MTAESVYELENVRQVYNGVTVLRIETLVVEPRSIVGVLGPNGSGKSTLLRLLAFLEPPAQGRIAYQGLPAHAGSLSLRRRVTLLDQSPYLLKRTVAGIVGFGLKLRGVRQRGGRVRRALGMVGLDPDAYGQRRWHQLSGGEAQRVALASRLVLRPEVLLLDEPTANLDEESTERIRQAALAARREWGATLVLVSHDREWLLSVCERTLRLRKGAILSDT
jgi:tungstate transport system ATP-binding protein